MLADAGWEVCLLEAAEEVGGAVRSVLRPAGYVTDLYSAFYPLTAVSPVLRSLRLARFLALPARRMGQELFRGESGRLLLAGNALHSDIAIDAPPSGVYGWLLAMLGQDVGFPVPVGGAGELAAALARRAQVAGAQLCIGQ